MLLEKLYFYIKNKYKPLSLKKRELDKLRIKKLKNITEHAYENIPFYRRFWTEKGFHPREIVEIEDLEKIPKFTKGKLIEKYEKFVPPQKNSVLEGFDPGEGNLRIPWSETATDYKDMVYYRTLNHIEYNPKEKIAYYWTRELKEDVYNKIGFFKKILINSDLGEREQLKILVSKKPDYLYYFPTSLFFISKLIRNRNIELKKYPKFIVTQGEILTEGMKREIKRAFNAPIFDLYATREVGIIGVKLKERYRINSDFVLMERGKQVDDLGSKVILTSLVKNLFPIIRLRMEDVINKTEGPKTIDEFETLFGKESQVEQANHLKSFRNWINQIAGIQRIFKFQFVIDGPDVTLKIVPFGRKYKKNKEISEKIKKRTNFQGEIEFVEKIKKLENGKIPLFYVE